VYRLRRKWRKSIALGVTYDMGKRHSSPALATEAFIAASAILNKAILVDPTNSAAVMRNRPTRGSRVRRRASLAYGESKPVGLGATRGNLSFDVTAIRSRYAGNAPTHPTPMSDAAKRPPRPILRKANAVCFEDDDVVVEEHIPMTNMEAQANLSKKSSVGSNSSRLLSIPKQRRAISLTSYSSSNAAPEYDGSRTPSTLNSFDDDSSVFTEQSSFEDDRMTAQIAVPGGNTTVIFNGLPESSSIEARVREMTAPIIAVTMVGEDNEEDVRRNMSRCSSVDDKTALAPDRTRKRSALNSLLQRTGSIASQISTLSSPILVHGSDGEVRVYRNRQSMPANIRASKGSVCVRDKRAREMGKRRSETKTAKKSSYIVMAYLVMWLPLPVTVGVTSYYIHNVDAEMEGDNLQWHIDLQLGVFCFSMLTAATNPVIYGLAIRSFRIAFNKICRSDWNKLKNWGRCSSL
jgi:hypothetical protein